MRRTVLGLIGLVILISAVLIAEEWWSMLKVGEIAPDFELVSHTGTTVRLSAYRGRKNVVLFFYPKDFTAGCTRQVCAFRDSFDVFERSNVTILGVSYDDVESHRRFAESHRIPYYLLSDTSQVVSRLYGARWLGGFFPMPKRVTYVIDRQGLIRAIIHREFDIEGHFEEVTDALKYCG